MVWSDNLPSTAPCDGEVNTCEWPMTTSGSDDTAQCNKTIHIHPRTLDSDPSARLARNFDDAVGWQFSVRESELIERHGQGTRRNGRVLVGSHQQS